jgi:hypothetical protein
LYRFDSEARFFDISVTSTAQHSIEWHRIEENCIDENRDKRPYCRIVIQV